MLFMWIEGFDAEEDANFDGSAMDAKRRGGELGRAARADVDLAAEREQLPCHVEADAGPPACDYCSLVL